MKVLKGPVAQFFIDLMTLFVVGAVIGAVVGLFEAIFVLVLNFVVDLRQNNGNCLWLIGLPLAGLVIVWLFDTFGKSAKEGMGIIFKINQGTAESMPRTLVPLMMVSTWISQLFGASVGKEGVGLQIGAAISNSIANYVPYLKEKKTVIVVTGMAAGFTGVFGTPFTAVIFAMEILVSGLLEYRALASSISAAFASFKVIQAFGISKEAFPLQLSIEFDIATYGWQLLGLGIIFGLTGALFAICMHKGHAFFEKKFDNPYKRIFYCSIPLAILLWVLMDGRYCGSGTNLIAEACQGKEIFPWDFAIKLLLSVVSLSIGFVGGDVTPLFATGATLGAFLGPLFGLPATLGAALGYSAILAAGTNTWVAPLVIGMEIFGFEYFPFFFITTSFAYLVNGNQSIYGLQRKLAPVFALKDLDWQNPQQLELTISSSPQTSSQEEELKDSKQEVKNTQENKPEETDKKNH